MSNSDDVDKLASAVKSLDIAPTPAPLKVGLTYDPRMCGHVDIYSPHPECPQRIVRIFDELVERGFVERCERVAARVVEKEEVCLVHGSNYWEEVISMGELSQSDLDHLACSYNSIYLSPESSSSALLSAGSVVELTTQVITGKLRSGVAVVRPPGHHAEADTAMGFCLFNNIGVAAAVAMKKHDVKRILVFDWDVHHGNATQNMFLGDPGVLFVSLHRHDHGTFYPGKSGSPSIVGTGEGKGKNINIGWNTRDVHDNAYLAALKYLILPICEEYKPELVLISAGFDSAEGDPLGGIHISPAGYSQMTRMLMDLVGGKVVVALEGGYNLTSISKSMAAVVSTLLGDEPLEVPLAPISESCFESLKETLKIHKDHWPSLKNVEIPKEICKVASPKKQ